MNLFRVFMELDEAYNDRQRFIDELKKAGKNYNFDKYTDAQLYRMCQRLQTPAVKKVVKEPEHDLDLDFEPAEDFACCDFCGERLTDFGQCPVCDFGEEDLTEDIKYCWFGYYLDKDGKKKIIYATKDSTSYDGDEGAEKLEELIPEPYTKFVFRGSVNDRQAEREGWTLVETLTEAAVPKFAAHIDSDILKRMDEAIPDAPTAEGDNNKCSYTVLGNALYYVNKGEKVKFCLGNIRVASKQVTHCWIEHGGKITQTRYNGPDTGLMLKYSVDLEPNDVDGAKKRIADLINGINDGSITEGLLDKPSMSSWVSASGNKINVNNLSTASAQSQTAPTQNQTPTPHLPSGRYAVRIVSDHGRLRALGTDGVHPAAWVAFPNDLRQFDGQQYEVDQLIWNGKNYRVAGNIVEI